MRWALGATPPFLSTKDSGDVPKSSKRQSHEKRATGILKKNFGKNAGLSRCQAFVQPFVGQHFKRGGLARTLSGI